MHDFFLWLQVTENVLVTVAKIEAKSFSLETQ